MKNLTNKIILLVAAVCMVVFANPAHSDTGTASEIINETQITSMGVKNVDRGSLNSVERRVRHAAVKVYSQMGGHGSGTYVRHMGFHLVITAAHVTRGDIGDLYRIGATDSSSVLGVLVYEDSDIDAAVILVPRIQDRTPMRYRPLSVSAEVGTDVVYSGYPSDLSLLTIRGAVAGYDRIPQNGPVILLHTYGWFGCSGSGIYDDRGRYVGVLWGVSVERFPYPQVIEDIIWVTPSYMIDENEILEGIVNVTSGDADISGLSNRRTQRRAARLVRN